MISRRDFLYALAAAPLAAVEPFERKGARFTLSLAAYSFRENFPVFKGKEKPLAEGAQPMTMLDFLDYCAAQNCAAEPTAYFFPPEADVHWYREFKRKAFLQGVPISGTAVGNNFALPEGDKLQKEIDGVKNWIDLAAEFGAPHIRVFAGVPKDLSVEQARKSCVLALEECADYAGSKGIFLGLENHGGIVAEVDGLLAIVQAVRSDWLGINLDTGNFHTEDPYGDLEKCAPYAVNVQVKARIQKKGGEKEKSDFTRIVDILGKADYRGFVALEYESSEDPFQQVPVLLKELRRVLEKAEHVG